MITIPIYALVIFWVLTGLLGPVYSVLCGDKVIRVKHVLTMLALGPMTIAVALSDFFLNGKRFIRPVLNYVIWRKK